MYMYFWLMALLSFVKNIVNTLENNILFISLDRFASPSANTSFITTISSKLATRTILSSLKYNEEISPNSV